MNKFFTLLTCLFISTASLAQTQAIVPFKAMGHLEDEPIFGMNGATFFYYKIAPQYEVNGSKLVIYFEPSQALIKDKSYITCLLAQNRFIAAAFPAILSKK